MTSTNLMKISYYDSKAEVRLEAYADTIVIEQDSNTSYIAAIRFGGYPESVKGMAEAIYGGGSITIERDDIPLVALSFTKRYCKEFSHDGIYAEATLLVQDMEYESEENNNDIKNTKSKPRKCYIFCEEADSDCLFAELDKKTSVPLIPEFKNYILDELQNRNILKTLNVISYKEKFDVWILELSSNESNIISVVNDGLKSGAISIPSSQKGTSCTFPAINSVTQYLNTFGIMIAERIKKQFNPLFDPTSESLSEEILSINDNIKKNVGYSLYNAQLAVAEAHKRCLEQKKVTLCISECGSGKTRIGITALHAYQQKKTKSKHFNIVLCPSHMTKKWVREIEESLPNTFAVVVNNITELNKVFSAYENDSKTCYIVISKEKARDGYMKRPSALFNERRNAFLCPDCYNTIMMNLIDSGSKYKVKADQSFFRKETKDNHKCENCGSLLWTVLAPNKQSQWIKVSSCGFVHRHLAHQLLDSVKNKIEVYEKIKSIADNPSDSFPNTGAHRRVSLSTYIKRKMKGKIDGLIIDELHNYNNNSGQGDSMAELFCVAKKVIGMTATLINGYSSGIFHLLFRIAPHLMIKDGKNHDKSAEFNIEYGVTESVYEIKQADYNSNRRTAKKKIREKQLPGVSPLVYSRFLLESAAFLSLNDISERLPEYEEIPIQLSMNEDVLKEYKVIENKFKSILKYERSISKKILSSYLGLLTVYPDQPYGHKPIVHPFSGEDLVVPKDTSCFDELHEKDKNVLELVHKKVALGGRVIIYTSWIRIDTQEKLLKLLIENGYRTSILNTSVAPNKREEWVQNQVNNGIQVLITNPSLVETGLDLNDFTTLYYYNISYNLFTLRQSSRRSWRINQKAPRIEVYFSYYEGSMQHRAIRLMASKLAVAGIIEGNFTDEGLAAMSDCQDMTTALARELTHGIKDEVEDLNSIFKKMAILKPSIIVNEQIHTDIANDNLIETIEDISDIEVLPVQSTENNNPYLFLDDEYLFMTQENIKADKVKKKKSAAIDEGQITLFDYLNMISAEQIA